MHCISSCQLTISGREGHGWCERWHGDELGGIGLAQQVVERSAGVEIDSLLLDADGRGIAVDRGVHAHDRRMHGKGGSVHHHARVRGERWVNHWWGVHAGVVRAHLRGDRLSPTRLRTALVEEAVNHWAHVKLRWDHCDFRAGHCDRVSSFIGSCTRVVNV